MATRIQVSGLKELGEAMSKMSSAVAMKIARGMTNAGAHVVKKDAIARAPKHDKPHMLEGVLVQPGNLKKNIVAKRVSKSDLTSEHIVTVRGKKKDGYAARYGRLQEFGTVKEPPQPFLRPAFDNNVNKAVDAMKKYGEKRIEAEAKKVGK